jgi:transposase
MRKVSKRIRRHLENILISCLQRITDGVAEELNSKIMAIKRKACDYRIREYFNAHINFFCGGLDIYPVNSRWDFHGKPGRF